MKTNFIKLFVLIYLNNCFGQDIQLTQSFANPTVINPAFAGANACSKFSMISRSQWTGVSTAYQTSIVSYDHFFVNNNVGIGLILGEDRAGSGGLKTTFASCAFSYEATLNRNSSLRFGIQPGVAVKSIDLNKLYFGDQIVRGGNVITIENTPVKRNYFDLNAGALYTNKNCWLGVSFSHINQPNESFYNAVSSNLPVKYSIHGGVKFLVNKSEHLDAKKGYLTPVFLYKKQNKFDQFDIGLYYSQNKVSFGMWYRGIPLFKAYKPGYANDDAIAFMFGLTLNKVKIGYSYDLTISKLTYRTMGSHELSMSYAFCTPEKKKPKRSSRPVYCPKF